MVAMSRRRTAATVVAALAVALSALMLSEPAAGGGARGAAADDDPLAVTLTSMVPAHLEPGRPLRLRGTVQNVDTEVWADASVYLVIRPTPLTTRTEIDTLLSAGAPPGGSRLIEIDTFDNIGSLAPTQVKSFRLEVPYDTLGISQAAGVYPVGVQVLATDESGLRSTTAAGEASTLIPLVPDKTDPVGVATVWPFVTALRRGPDGGTLDPSRLLSEISPDGRLGRLLEMATASTGPGSTVLVDPALLDAAGDLSRGPDSGATPDDDNGVSSTQARETARVFLAGLVELAEDHPLWVPAYGRPDEQALTETSDGRGGRTVSHATRRATRNSLKRYQLEGLDVYWPAGGLASAETLASVKTRGGPLAMLSPKVLDGWLPTDGVVVDAATTALRDGDDAADAERLRTFVTDPTLLAGGSGSSPALEARQRTLSEAALLAIGGAAQQPDSASLALVLGPAWDPGPAWRQGDLASLYRTPWIRPVDADDAVDAVRVAPPEQVLLPKRLAPRAIRVEQVRLAAGIVRKARDYASIIDADTGTSAYYDELAALAVSSSWRTEPTAGLANAEAQDAAASAILAKVAIESNQFVTLPGTSGRFPLTVTNGLDKAVRVGVELKTSSANLAFDPVDPVEIPPGQVVTVTVSADGDGNVSNSAVVARLTTPDGETFGTPAEFNVRTSVVGTIIWVVMGVAGALAVVAFGRQIRNRRRQRVKASPATAQEPAP